MSSYYNDTLAAEKLRRAYECATPRVKQYLDAEINHAALYLKPFFTVLELGCGYGRILRHLGQKVRTLVGVDISQASLMAAKQDLENYKNIHLVQMNAQDLGFAEKIFDCVLCLQNGLSAFHVEPIQVIRESFRVTRPGGVILLSSYAERFWERRLEWFRKQAELGLIGPIDWNRTGDGEIVCTDGFHATTIKPEYFDRLLSGRNLEYSIVEVDDSGLFCEIHT